MDHRTQGILIIALMIALSLIFQVQMKLFAGALGLHLARAQDWRMSLAGFVEVSISWRGLWIAVLAAALFLLWLLALTRLELSFALPIASIALVITALGGGLWLGEDLNWMRVVGLVTTAVGIGLVIGS
jgi:drug/metabolite transporter (DMT)-like permease